MFIHQYARQPYHLLKGQTYILANRSHMALNNSVAQGLTQACSRVDGKGPQHGNWQEQQNSDFHLLGFDTEKPDLRVM